jgi:hypothetical protein
MGGVDLLDQLISTYRILIRSKKRMIMHFIDFTLVNSWIEYRKDCVSNGIPKKEELDLLSFLNALILMRVAESLINLGKPKGVDHLRQLRR